MVELRTSLDRFVGEIVNFNRMVGNGTRFSSTHYRRPGSVGNAALDEISARAMVMRESGMVKSARWVAPLFTNVISAIIFMGGIILSLYLRHLGYVDDVFVLRMLWVATGWAFGYTLIGVGTHIGLPRYMWLGILGGIASTAMLFMPLPFGQAALVFGLFWCLVLTVSGAITLLGAVPLMKDQRP